MLQELNNKELKPFLVLLAVSLIGVIGVTILWFLSLELIKYLLKIKIWEWF